MSIDVTSCPPSADEGPVETTLHRQASGVKAIPHLFRIRATRARPDEFSREARMAIEQITGGEAVQRIV